MKTKNTSIEKNTGKVLPFPPIPTASKAATTLAKSFHNRRPQPYYLPSDALNVLIIFMYYVVFGQIDTLGELKKKLS